MAMCGVGAVAIVTGWSMPATRSLLESNLGALLQTRAELSRYRWPQWPLQDALRRSDSVSLAAAIDHYRAALAIDPGNAVANRRLGQIGLSMGRYDDARLLLEAAYRTAPDQNATRAMFGESLAVTGDVALAAEVWRTVAKEQDQLQIRRWWYTSVDDHQRAQWVSDAIALTYAR
jgi:tetratricopeptide (TPR) repeat protein